MKFNAFKLNEISCNDIIGGIEKSYYEETCDDGSSYTETDITDNGQKCTYWETDNQQPIDFTTSK